MFRDKKPRALRRALPSGFLCSFREEKSKEREGEKEDESEHWRRIRARGAWSAPSARGERLWEGEEEEKERGKLVDVIWSMIWWVHPWIWRENHWNSKERIEKSKETNEQSMQTIRIIGKSLQINEQSMQVIGVIGKSLKFKGNDWKINGNQWTINADH